MNEVENFKKQHLNTYKNATKEIINNNTISLVEGDILSLVKKPPLDSMDSIKTKLLSLAKKEKIVLDTKELENIISTYRNNLSKEIMHLVDVRNLPLLDKIDSFEPSRETEIIKITKKELENINKNIKKEIKKIVKDSYEDILFKNLDKLYVADEGKKEVYENINKNFKKYMNSNYLKQLNDNISIKILVKDQTLMSGVLEQGERYLFTKANSHIFDK